MTKYRVDFIMDGISQPIVIRNIIYLENPVGQSFVPARSLK